MQGCCVATEYEWEDMCVVGGAETVDGEICKFPQSNQNLDISNGVGIPYTVSFH